MRESGCENKRTRKIDKVISQRVTAHNHRTMCTQCFSKRMYSGEHPFFQTEFIHQSSAVFAKYTCGMGFVNNEIGLVFFTKLGEFFQGCGVTIHRINRFHCHKNGSFGLLQFFFKIVEVVMREFKTIGVTQTATVNDTGVNQFIANKGVTFHSNA